MIDGQNATATEQTGDQTMADIAGSIDKQDSTSGSNAPADNVSEFQSFVQQNAKTTEELTNKVQELSKAHEDLVHSQHREAVNKEIDNAAERINEAVGGDKDMARLYLESQYNKDPNLKKVWDSRGESPEALEEAIKVLSNEWKAKNQNLIDPQVAENQRALMDSQTSGGTVQSEDLDTKLNNMNDAEFMREMRRLAT